MCFWLLCSPTVAAALTDHKGRFGKVPFAELAAKARRRIRSVYMHFLMGSGSNSFSVEEMV